MNKFLTDFLESLKKNCNYTILEYVNNQIYLLVDNYKKIKKIYKIHNYKIVLKNGNIVSIIPKNHGFLDPNWEKDILKRNTISNLEQAYVEIYDTYCHNNIFKYDNKEHINKKICSKFFLSTEQLVNMLEEFMKQNKYKYYYCNLKKINYNTKINKNFYYIRKLDIINKKIKYICLKIPGFLCKICFFKTKILNKMLASQHMKKIKCIDKIDNCIEVNKKEIKFGTMYYILKFKNGNKGFLKGYDYYNTSRNEYLANKKLKKYGFCLDLLATDKLRYALYEYNTNITLEEYLQKNSFTENNLKVFIDKMTNIITKLNNEKVIHRDIREENIILIMQNETLKDVKLIDFGYCLINSQEYLNYNNIFHRKILKSLGDLYKPDVYKWDDTIAFLNLLEKIDKRIYENFNYELNKIIKLKGKNKYIVGGDKLENCFFNFTL